MYQLATLDDLYQQRHTLGLYCVACDRWAEADLPRLVAAGHGGSVITRTHFRCSDCGAAAEKQVRPPVPQVGGAVAYVDFSVATTEAADF